MTMKPFNKTLLVCLAAAPLLSACYSDNDGYYDRNGNWVATDTPHNRGEHSHPPLPGGTNPPYADTRYDRPGYYDYNGYYLDRRSTNLRVPDDMLPPRGMCRVWFTDRDFADQPPIESCAGIKGRVPVGAYVIFGG